ncbi:MULTISPECIES: helix-turn-helix domain-containing protein [Actinomadura]|uniref:Helix-turn-helix domain-containing protein n=1 Tax=Actinomadura yumaensis TaxID=111807 RepID=A0ABW2C9M1_9ACTN|nr:helix-turn-helix transcriptional regulator [Actinomadura sp. J1-007]
MIEVPTVRRRLLGAELRRLRDKAGLTLEDAARILECDRSKISRIETGHRGMRPKELRELLSEYGVDEARRHALAELARQANKRGWWQDYEDILAEPYQDFISLEASAASIWAYEAQLIPGLLQTERYSAAIAEASLVKESKEQRERFVAVRMARQRVLNQGEPSLAFWAILGEAALRQRVGGIDVMREQLHRLVELSSDLPNVNLQVLPFDVGAHAANAGTFVLLTFPEPTDLGIVYLDSLTGGMYLEEPRDVNRHRLVYEHLRASALPTQASIKLIEKVAREL